MGDKTWEAGPQRSLVDLFEARLAEDPDGEYLDVCGASLTAAGLVASARRLAGGLDEMGVGRGERVATLLDNRPEAVLAWAGTVLGGRISVPVNTAYKGEYLRHQLSDSGARALVVSSDFEGRALEVVPGLDQMDHLVVVGAGRTSPVGGSDRAGGGRPDRPRGRRSPASHTWEEVLSGSPAPLAEWVRPSDLATFIYTGGTTGPSKGCMLSHGYHEALARQVGTCWERAPDDVVWTPLPLYHFNAIATAVVGTLVFGGRGAIGGRFSVSAFWPEMNRTGATITSTLGTMAYLLAHDADRPEMPRSGQPVANRSLRLMGAAPLPEEVDRVIRERFGISTFSGAYGVTEASLISWQPPGISNRPNAAGVVNDEYFDVRIFDDDDNEVATGDEGEIVVRPRRAHVMFEGYWGRPEATVAASRNWWYHTGDIGRVDADRYLYFVDRKADYLRRRGENISSFEVESILMGHGSLADVAVHAVPSKVTEDDVKVTATLKPGASLEPEELFRWCVEQLPYFVVPRYIELREELPRSPVGRVLKRQLRDEGVTASTWDCEAAGVTFERR